MNAVLVQQVNGDATLDLSLEVRESANMGPSDENVGHSSLSSDLLEGVLHVGSLGQLVELVDVVGDVG